MKKYKNIIIYFILLLFLQSCDQKILDKAPLDRYSDGTVWTDIEPCRSLLKLLL